MGTRRRLSGASRAAAALAPLLFLSASVASSPGCRRRVPAAAPPADRLTLSLVGTSDLHGHLEALPAFGGYLANLRRARALDGGAVVLVDAGDMFQGTLPSNLGEGAPVVAAYARLGYSAVAIGNHEFDFGPVGPAATVPPGTTEDPRGALRARAAEAPFPFLDANLIDDRTGTPPAWSNVVPDVLIEVAGIKVGIVGVTTASTPRTTLPANLAGLTVAPLAPAIAKAAVELHARGATVILAAAHAGGACRRFDTPEHVDSCEPDSEIFQVARALPAGGAAGIDAIVAGHTHNGIAARVSGIPIIQSFANGRDFGRIDLTIERASGRAALARIFPPQRICEPRACAGESYEGAPVVPDAAVETAIAPGLEAARALGARPLGPNLAAPIRRALKTESPLGNLVADLMRASEPGADVALTNGGGIRADLPAGPLTYGSLFEALPFDNTLVTMSLEGGQLAALIARNLAADNGIVSISGVRAEARCARGRIEVTLRRADGRALAPDARLTLVTSNFLAAGGDGLLGHFRPPLREGPLIRDALADLLRARRTPLVSAEAQEPAHPRLVYPGARPVRCAPR